MRLDAIAGMRPIGGPSATTMCAGDTAGRRGPCPNDAAGTAMRMRVRLLLAGLLMAAALVADLFGAGATARAQQRAAEAPAGETATPLRDPASPTDAASPARPDCAMLAAEVRSLRRRVEELTAMIARLHAEGSTETARTSPEDDGAQASLAPFTIAIHRTDRDGPLLKDPIAKGTTLAFVARVPLAGSPDLARRGTLAWRLHGPDGRPVAGIGRTTEITEDGGVHEETFRIAGLPEGRYRVTLTHRLAATPEVRRQASVVFRIHQPLRVTRLDLTSDPKGKRTPTIFNRNIPVFAFVYYELPSGLEEVDVAFRLHDEQAGKRIWAHAFKRARRKGSPLQRVGIEIPRELLEEPGAYAVEAVVSTPGMPPSRARRGFTYGVLRLAADAVSMPRELASGSSARFAVRPPDFFRAPFRLGWHLFRSGLKVEIDDDRPGGRITATKTVSGPERVSIELTLSDAEGRAASWRGSVTVLPAQ